MRRPFWIVGFVAVIVGLVLSRVTFAATSATDTDGDGLPDVWETQVFHTDPTKADTDGDGYPDRLEIVNGYDPNGSGSLKDADYDHDGLNDRMELLFGSDPMAADTDGDGYPDGLEVDSGYSPTSASPMPLQKEIVIHLKNQQLDQRLGGVTLASYTVSTGKPSTPTPVGTFHVLNKNPRAWSHMASLWMPWWMEFTWYGDGIHELPEWPGGAKEGADHLGTPVSHGCVRLGVGPAKNLYDWTPVGTPVIVQR